MVCGIIFVLEIVVIIEVFVWLGLINIYVIFVCYLLIILVLFGLIFGEKVGWWCWVVVGVGFCGILIVLKLGSGVFFL